MISETFLRTEEEKKARIRIIDEYLYYQCKLLKNYYKHFPKKINPSSKNAAVIVEPRSDHKSFESVCRNVMYFLPENWNLIVYSYDEELVKQRLTNMEYIFYKTEKPSFNPNEYSQLLMSSTFWNSIPADNIIIFQTDSYITRHFTEEYINRLIKYPFIGAVYTIDYNQNPIGFNICSVDYFRNFSMSGGFSFRNKQSMLNCVENVTLDDIVNYRKKNNLEIMLDNIFYEDFYFEHALHLLGYKLPSREICSEFSCQVQYDLTHTHSFHGIYRDYVYEYLIYMLTPSLYDMNDKITRKIDELLNR